MKVSALLILALVVCAVSLGQLQSATKPHAGLGANQDREVLYLPNGQALHLLSFGYSSVLSHLIWFNTVSYFAKHYRSDKQYTWFYHMCDLATQLNPRADYLYQTCGILLAWEGFQPREAVQIFSAATKALPQNWRFFYLRGFVRAFFLSDSEGARQDFIHASELPDAHPIVASLAAKDLLKLDNPENALQFLDEALRDNSSAQMRSVLLSRRAEILYEIGFRKMEKAAAAFAERFGHQPVSLAELAKSGLVDPALHAKHFADPFGGHYDIVPETGAVISTSGHKRDNLHWNKHP